MITRNYSELRHFTLFEERFEYLKLSGGVGRETFGFDRYLNQIFYNSREWENARRVVILRDNGCDLGIEGYEIYHNILIHHMNPISPSDILHHEDWILDPEYLITTTYRTHNNIHFGTKDPYPKVVLARSPNDTKLW